LIAQTFGDQQRALLFARRQPLDLGEAMCQRSTRVDVVSLLQYLVIDLLHVVAIGDVAGQDVPLQPGLGRSLRSRRISAATTILFSRV